MVGVVECSIIPNFPKYVLGSKKGDCGMQTLLFMTMERYRGIPVCWQSGRVLDPREVRLHDWCEVYYEGIDEVTLNMSFGLHESNNRQLRNFRFLELMRID